jgi:hypothetical protein
MVQTRNIKKLVEETQAKRLVETCSREWEDNIKVNIGKLEHQYVDWIELPLDGSTDGTFGMVMNTFFHERRNFLDI